MARFPLTQARVFFLALVLSVGGIAAASFFPENRFFLLFPIGLGSFLLFFAWEGHTFRSRERVLWTIGVLLLAFAAGFGRGMSVESIQESLLQQWIGRDGTFDGRVRSRPEQSESSVRFTIDTVAIEGVAVDPKHAMLVVASPDTRVTYTDRIRLHGKIRAPESYGSFDYPAYLARNGITALAFFPKVERIGVSPCSGISPITCVGRKLTRALEITRESLVRHVRTLLPSPHAQLLAGILIGERASLPREVTDDFRASGLLHIVAMSGYNIAVIVAVVFRLGQALLLPRRINVWWTFFLIGVFIILAGAQASVIRAGIMGGLVLIAYESGRPYSVRNALAFAAAGMALIHPEIVRWDIGFQLSFLATVGILVVAPRIGRYFRLLPEAFAIRETITISLAAFLMTAPLIFYYFHSFSPLAPIANAAVLPALPVTMGFGFLALVGGFVPDAVGNFLAFPAWVFLEYIVRASSFFAHLPG
ncbi:MAG: ComEC family competence protein, partial [Parcubacteria group bacterium]|nr:ComEC family competence protein [Parcubacteria group bacterium]